VCWHCDHPTNDPDDYLTDMRSLMNAYGWAIQYVDDRSPRSPWAYTVGLSQCGLPELVVTGLPVRLAMQYLNDEASRLMHAEPPSPGETTQPVGAPRFEIVEVSQPAVHLPIAVRIGGPDVRAIQMVWCDDRGKWPWDSGFRSGRWSQVVLGERSRPSDVAC